MAYTKPAASPAVMFIQEARNRCTAYKPPEGSVREMTQRYRGTIYSAVSSGRDITSGYTVSDRAALAWAGLVEKLGDLPGCTQLKGKEQEAQELIEQRLLKERIKGYRGEFNGRLTAANEMQSYCRGCLGTYSDNIRAHKTAALTDHSKMKEIERHIGTLEDDLGKMVETATKAQTHDERVTCGASACQRHNEINEARTALSDFTVSMKENTRTAKVYTILHASMEDRYQRIAEMCAILRQKGTHLDQMLQEWENGASSAHVVLLKQKLEECDFTLRRVDELNKEYVLLEQQAARTSTLPDNALDHAYKKACAQRNERSTKLDADRKASSDETLDVVLT